MVPPALGMTTAPASTQVLGAEQPRDLSDLQPVRFGHAVSNVLNTWPPPVSPSRQSWFCQSSSQFSQL